MLNHFKILLLLTIVPACTSTRPEIEAVCETDPVFNYILKWDISPMIDGNVRIYRSTDPENFDTEKNAIAECPISDESIRIKADHSLKRQYFLLRFDNKYDEIVATRAQKFNFIQNFRDLGGYKNCEQKQIRWGMIYRSGKIDTLDYLSTKRIMSLHLKTLIDFRDPGEFILPPSKLQLDNVIHLPVSTFHTHCLKEKIENKQFKRGDASILMQDMFIDLSRNAQKSFKSMFNQLLVEENYPIVLTCNFGKDYTGFSVALILSALEIPEEIIMDDYLLSNTYLDKRSINADLSKCPDNIREDIQEALTTVMTADEKYLDCAFNRIKRKYGSIDNYLEKELSLTPEKRKKLQHILLH